MKKKVILLVLLLSVIGMKAQNKDFWIYFAIGQGNMVGTAKIEQNESAICENFMAMQTENSLSVPLGTWKQACFANC